MRPGIVAKLAAALPAPAAAAAAADSPPPPAAASSAAAAASSAPGSLSVLRLTTPATAPASVAASAASSTSQQTSAAVALYTLAGRPGTKADMQPALLPLVDVVASWPSNLHGAGIACGALLRLSTHPPFKTALRATTLPGLLAELVTKPLEPWAASTAAALAQSLSGAGTADPKWAGLGLRSTSNGSTPRQGGGGPGGGGIPSSPHAARLAALAMAAGRPFSRQGSSTGPNNNNNSHEPGGSSPGGIASTPPSRVASPGPPAYSYHHQQQQQQQQQAPQQAQQAQHAQQAQQQQQLAQAQAIPGSKSTGSLPDLSALAITERVLSALGRGGMRLASEWADDEEEAGAGAGECEGEKEGEEEDANGKAKGQSAGGSRAAALTAAATDSDAAVGGSLPGTSAAASARAASSRAIAVPLSSSPVSADAGTGGGGSSHHGSLGPGGSEPGISGSASGGLTEQDRAAAAIAATLLAFDSLYQRATGGRVSLLHTERPDVSSVAPPSVEELSALVNQLRVGGEPAITAAWRIRSVLIESGAACRAGLRHSALDHGMQLLYEMRPRPGLAPRSYQGPQAMLVPLLLHVGGAEVWGRVASLVDAKLGLPRLVAMSGGEGAGDGVEAEEVISYACMCAALGACDAGFRARLFSPDAAGGGAALLEVVAGRIRAGVRFPSGPDFLPLANAAYSLGIILWADSAVGAAETAAVAALGVVDGLAAVVHHEGALCWVRLSAAASLAALGRAGDPEACKVSSIDSFRMGAGG